MEKSMQWIPIITRDMTAEEKQEMCDHMGWDVNEIMPDDCWRYVCPLPEHNQSVLITTGFAHEVVITTFCDDYGEGCYFEDYEDRDDVLAWMPLPEAYEKED